MPQQVEIRTLRRKRYRFMAWCRGLGPVLICSAIAILLVVAVVQLGRLA